MGLLNLSISSRGQRNGASMQLIVDHNMADMDVDELETVAAEVTEVQVKAEEETTPTSLMALMSQIQPITLHPGSGTRSGHQIGHLLCRCETMQMPKITVMQEVEAVEEAGVTIHLTMQVPMSAL